VGGHVLGRLHAFVVLWLYHEDGVGAVGIGTRVAGNCLTSSMEQGSFELPTHPII